MGEIADMMLEGDLCAGCGGDGPLLLYETMIFGGSDSDEYQERCSTRLGDAQKALLIGSGAD